jgi:blue copper oxidase
VGFVIGCGAFAASSVLCGRNGEPAPFTRPLPIPELIDAAASRHSVNLIASPGQHALIEGKSTRVYGYSAPILGPAVRVRRGDEAEMVVENRLDAATTVHWHGLLVPGHNDGGPQQLIQPGERWRPVLKIDQPAATLWFHPNPHGDTARQIYMEPSKSLSERGRRPKRSSSRGSSSLSAAIVTCLSMATQHPI